MGRKLDCAKEFLSLFQLPPHIESSVMKPIEIIQRIRLNQPEVLGKMPDARAAAVARAVLLEMAQIVKETKEGDLKFPGFGVLVVKQVPTVKDGLAVTVRRVVYRGGGGKKKPL